MQGLARSLVDTSAAGWNERPSALRCQAGLQIIGAAEIKQRFRQGFQLIQRQTLDASGGYRAEGAAEAMELAEGDSGFAARFAPCFTPGFSEVTEVARGAGLGEIFQGAADHGVDLG